MYETGVARCQVKVVLYPYRYVPMDEELYMIRTDGSDEIVTLRDYRLIPFYHDKIVQIGSKLLTYRPEWGKVKVKKYENVADLAGLKVSKLQKLKIRIRDFDVTDTIFS